MSRTFKSTTWKRKRDGLKKLPVCTKHPKYKAIHYPIGQCVHCLRIWWLAEHLRGELA